METFRIKTDEEGEVLNHEQTYREIAMRLIDDAVIIGWTDGLGTHYDILFTNTAVREGDHIQWGIKPYNDLFVSIIRRGAFAFERCEHHPDYYAEKLGIDSGPTADALGELINGVISKMSDPFGE